MFGEYEHTIDAKGRMFLPAKFRLELGEKVVLSISVDHCVCIYPEAEWKKFVDSFSTLSPVKARNAKRLFCSTAAETDVDGQGRILVPATLRGYGDLGKTVKVIGVGEKAEIWNVEEFEKFKAGMDRAELEAELLELGM